MDINAVISEVSKEGCSVHVICMHMLDLRGLFKRFCVTLNVFVRVSNH